VTTSVNLAPNSERYTAEPDGNSPTPKADVPLVSSAPADLIMAMLAVIQRQLEKTDTRLTAIENKGQPSIPAWSCDPRNDLFDFGQDIGGVADDIDPQPTAEQLRLLQEKEDAEADLYYMQLDEQEQRRIDLERANAEKWKMLTPEVTDPIYVFDSQKPAIPPPPKQQNGLPHLTRLGDLSYAQKASKGKSTAAPPAHQNPTPSGRPTKQPLSNKQLEDLKVTRALIVAHTHATFGVSIPFQKNTPKASIVAAYKATAATARAATPTQPQPAGNMRGTPPGGRLNPTKVQNALTTTWTIRRNTGCADIPFTKPCRGNSTTLVRYLQDAIRETSPNCIPPINLLGSRWSYNQPNNFVLIFAGQPSIDSVRKYRKVILAPFNDTFQLIPSRGFTCLIIHGMPCIRKPNGSLLSSAEVLKELAINVPFQGTHIIDGPTWGKVVTNDPLCVTGAMSFILIDETNSHAAHMIRSQIWAYGVRVSVRHATPSYPFRQCTRCHELSHSTERCTRPPTFSRCAACGSSGHTSITHKPNCRRRHSMPGCDCPPWCFNCNRANLTTVGHISMDDSCPLKKHMHRDSPGDSQPTVSAHALTTLPRTTTEPPTATATLA
jgi:hypothetical protein